MTDPAVVPENSTDLDGTSLVQALLDVEVANQRCIELMRVHVEQNKQIATLEDELEHMRLRAAHAERVLLEIQGSRAYRAARRVGDLRSRPGSPA